jgi:hypothetical protein
MADTKRGRKSKYETDVLPFIDDIKKAVEAGATLEEVANALGIAKSTLCKYKNEKKELKDAFARGRESIVFEIKAALLKKALGYEYKEKKTVAKTNENGDPVIVAVEEHAKHQPPSETAANMLLRNYDKEWCDSDKGTADLKKQKLNLEKAIAKANNFDLDI